MNTKERINDWMTQLTLEEKACLCTGQSFWSTAPIERLNIPAIQLADGPAGLRYQKDGNDHLGMGASEPATCFPSVSALAASWDPKLVGRVGSAIAKEAKAFDVNVLLAPGANLKRSPLCGRNFEYFSEDPMLTSELSQAYINGVQDEGVGVSLKHFAVNNQETYRLSIDAQVDERTLRELYLRSFETTIKASKPWTVMSAYNRINGLHCSENPWLLGQILRDEWGYDGLVVSDWFAVNNLVRSIEAGMDLEMPSGGQYSVEKIVQAVNEGALSMDALDRAVENILKLALKIQDQKTSKLPVDYENHHRTATEAASEAIVLLKNEASTLPIDENDKILVLGALAEIPRIQGSGSACVNPIKVESLLASLSTNYNFDIDKSYAKGYAMTNEDNNASLLDSALKMSLSADKVVIVAGLLENDEAESYDRSHLRLPEAQNALIGKIAEVHNHVIVLLQTGSAVEMPWIESVQAVMQTHLGGQGTGAAAARILYGDINPSGKLTETYPIKLAHTPAHLNYPGDGVVSPYSEGIFIGYRYYEKKSADVLFSFGHGLSYTIFDYSNLKIDCSPFEEEHEIHVQCDVTNTGDITGKEIVQLYVGDRACPFPQPDKALKAFKKVHLMPRETTTVIFRLTEEDFRYFDPYNEIWTMATGNFEMLLGRSSSDICLREMIALQGSPAAIRPIERNTVIGDLLKMPGVDDYIGGLFNEFSGMFGLSPDSGEVMNPKELEASIRFMPLRNLVQMTQGAFSEDMLTEQIVALNQLINKGGTL